MKKIILMLALALVAMPLSGKERILLSGNLTHGGFGGPKFSLGTINGQTGVFTGGWGAWVVNHTLIIGGGGYGLINDIEFGQTSDGTDRYLNLGYGGMIMGLTLGSDAPVHLTAHTMVGGGDVSYRTFRIWDGDNVDYNQSGSAHDKILVIHPTVSAELNVTRFFRLTIGANYRYVLGVDLEGLSNKDLNGLGAEVTFKFGKF